MASNPWFGFNRVHLNICVVIIYKSHNVLILSLQRQQHFIEWIITNNIDFINHRGNYIFNQLGLYNIKQCHAYSLGCLTFKCLHKLAPVVLCDSLHKLSDVKEHLCRRNTLCKLIFHTLEHVSWMRHSLLAPPIKCNSLPLKLKMTDSLACFKCQYEAFLAKTL